MQQPQPRQSWSRSAETAVLSWGGDEAHKLALEKNRLCTTRHGVATPSGSRPRCGAEHSSGARRLWPLVCRREACGSISSCVRPSVVDLLADRATERRAAITNHGARTQSRRATCDNATDPMCRVSAGIRLALASSVHPQHIRVTGKRGLVCRDALRPNSGGCGGVCRDTESWARHTGSSGVVLGEARAEAGHGGRVGPTASGGARGARRRGASSVAQEEALQAETRLETLREEAAEATA